MPVGAAGLAPRDPRTTTSPGRLGFEVITPAELKRLMSTPETRSILQMKEDRLKRTTGGRDSFELPVSRQRDEEPPPPPPSYPPPSKEYGRETGRPADK
jgi:hypothetical protein